jgi:hypothetical protein
MEPTSVLVCLALLVITIGAFGVMLRVVRAGSVLLLAGALIVAAELVPVMIAGSGLLGLALLMLLLLGLGIKLMQAFFRALLGERAGDHLTASIVFELLRLPFLLARGILGMLVRLRP